MRSFSYETADRHNRYLLHGNNCLDGFFLRNEGKNSGNVFPIFIALVLASIAWIFVDPELRRGLSSYTGIGYVPEVLEDLITKEYTIKLHGSYSSTCSQRVLLVANEKELTVDMHIVDFAKVCRPLCRRCKVQWRQAKGRITSDLN